MKHSCLRTFFGILTIISSFAALAAKDEIIKAEVYFPAPHTMSRAEAIRNAEEYARVEALRQAFGLVTSSENILIDTKEGEVSHTSAYSRTQSETNGEWLEDLDGTPKIISETPDEFGTMYCIYVKGRARRIEHTPIDIDCRLLCNGTDKDRDVVRAGEYHDGDNLYVYFSSPVSGFLAIYLEDDDPDMTMQAILPYDGQPVKSYPIVADREYIFFSLPLAVESAVEYAGRLQMFARKKVDFNRVHIIFSPKEFSRSSTSENRSAEQSAIIAGEKVNLMPRETTNKKFSNWLTKSRRKDPTMQYRKIPVHIKKIH